MKGIVRVICICILSFIFLSCQPSEKERMNMKINCYKDKLASIANDPIYDDIITQFSDTFKVLKKDQRYFGVPEIIENKLDDAIFFKKDKKECLLIVLERYIANNEFGKARIVRGMQQDKRWAFKVSLEYTFGEGYFKLFKENSFDNISKLARYDVLTDGDIRDHGCDIDEKYWFEELKKWKRAFYRQINFLFKNAQ
jgi:hypothetical protein